TDRCREVPGVSRIGAAPDAGYSVREGPREGAELDRAQESRLAGVTPSAEVDKPLVIAHRGASGAEYENSLAAFKKAGELGADGIELDIHATTDGGRYLQVEIAERRARADAGAGLRGGGTETPRLRRSEDAPAPMGRPTLRHSRRGPQSRRICRPRVRPPHHPAAPPAAPKAAGRSALGIVPGRQRGPGARRGCAGALAGPGDDRRRARGRSPRRGVRRDRLDPERDLRPLAARRTGRQRPLHQLPGSRPARGRRAHVTAPDTSWEVTVVGAGTMGHGIAYVSALAGCRVTLTDLRTDALEGARTKIESLLAGGLKRNKLTEDDRAGVHERLHFEPALAAAVRHADVVIEAVVEQMPVKQRIFAEVEREAPDGALLATNTSSLSVGGI